ncbi:hypothetical protein [Halobacillus naozhouensis]|uniref:Uncharacterized protein n=1 Tax=Halobacillus naozhouensis TaxID=554880 RepID=A0ABY8J336_9BACI|nr:hypothetical protein [Halobacillus naozhouensis]WFT76501.1 hypothetical protein P9989_09115 [Halobacillus naozhouensis]
MSTETLPSWFWVVYYLLLFITLSFAVFSLIRKRIKGLSIIAVVFAVTVPIISMLSSIGREEGLNELEHLVHQLQDGELWSIYVVIGYLYLLVWWVFILKQNKKINRTSF